jgi:hypothetical protein
METVVGFTSRLEPVQSGQSDEVLLVSPSGVGHWPFGGRYREMWRLYTYVPGVGVRFGLQGA